VFFGFAEARHCRAHGSFMRRSPNRSSRSF
jgi:hypothetical protein